MNEKALLSSLNVWAQPATLSPVLGPSTWHSRFLLENPESLQGPDLKLLEVSSNWAAAECMEQPECPTGNTCSRTILGQIWGQQNPTCHAHILLFTPSRPPSSVLLCSSHCSLLLLLGPVSHFSPPSPHYNSPLSPIKPHFLTASTSSVNVPSVF